MRWGRPLLLAVAAALLVNACGGAGSELDVHEAAAASPPPVDAQLVDGGWPEVAAWVAREADAGRPTVVNLFASWCAPCRAEAPLLRTAIAANPDVAWLGVAHSDFRDNAAGFLEEERLDVASVLDLDGTVAAAVGSRGLPTTAFFDARGRLVYVHQGVLTEPVLAQRLGDLRADARG